MRNMLINPAAYPDLGAACAGGEAGEVPGGLPPGPANDNVFGEDARELSDPFLAIVARMEVEAHRLW